VKNQERKNKAPASGETFWNEEQKCTTSMNQRVLFYALQREVPVKSICMGSERW